MEGHGRKLIPSCAAAERVAQGNGLRQVLCTQRRKADMFAMDWDPAESKLLSDLG